jgi:parallel beta-helix repeat protein
MKKILAIGIILLFLGSSIPAFAHTNENNLLSSRGNWLYVGGTGPGNYTRIQDAINNTNDWDTVFVFDDSSPYQESVKINKSILLIGENPETTVIIGNQSSDTIDFQHDNINLTGFTIKYSHYAVTNSVVNISNCSVYNNIIDDNKEGIRFDDCLNVTVSKNNFTNNYFALVIEKSRHIIISLNKIRFNSEGIVMDGNENITISLNTIELNSDIGICLYQYPSTKFIPNNYQVFKNTIKNNYQAIFNDEESGIFRNNLIESNTVGINLQSSSEVVISSNLMKNNSVGITIHDGSKNEINMNNFLQNERDAAFFYYIHIGFRRPHNVFRQNYWDTNALHGRISIKGQLSFDVGFYYAFTIRIPWFCFDWFPAQEPYDIPTMN